MLSERRTYTLATVGGFAALALLGIATSLVPRTGGLRDAVGVALILTLILGWHVLSFPRARAAHLLWLLAAPTLSILGGYATMSAAIESDAHYETGAPLWLGILGLIGLPAMLLWPAAWIALGVVQGRGRA